MKKIISALALVVGLAGTISVMAQTKSKLTITDYHQTAQTKFIEANGTRYAYRVLGNQTGIPVVMFQHFTGTMDNWDPAITNGLAQHFKVILFDNKGTGASDGKTPDNIADMAKDAEDFITALGFKKVNLFGFSMGGFITQQIALDRPQLVNKMILAGTGPKGGEGITEITKPLTEAGKMGSDEEVKLFLFYTKTDHSREMGKSSLAKIYKRKVNRDTECSNSSIMAQLGAILAWAKPDPELKSRLAAISQPVLVVNGNDDIMVPTVNSYIMFQNIPNAKLSLYPDAGHGSIFQYSGQFLAEAIPFFKN
jgi:pimeloyl-ACP methyl ester carboxylesterase